MTRPGRVLVVTGTDTEVGKTVATAALAAALTAAGERVVAYKPVQTGVVDDEDGDMPFVRGATGVPAYDGVRLREPMAPVQAATLEGRPLPALEEHVAAVRRYAAAADTVLVEGAGGLLVELDEHGRTLADLTAALASAGSAASVVVVARSGLGTLNHTMLTLEALHRRDLTVAGVVVGSLGPVPSAIELANLDHLRTRAGVPLLGVVPAGSGTLDPEAFRSAAPGWLPGGHALAGQRDVG
ncbi:dethiobiotin synthase [Luteipulveratus flavus]|uniref:ATP-dependent dethiobiotin synthetase BioD n=1 Tax=Luteipulveratus flavus TaxID=3031728 RepID=A0ABT6C516_9MICO|nr:dethiobiotin synthase [Luteipulveratus sp. YIM 133296]MDF8263895.1 dethiobiotin synthase [Luteipulveratus sp. YIM 133296]